MPRMTAAVRCGLALVASLVLLACSSTPAPSSTSAPRSPATASSRATRGTPQRSSKPASPAASGSNTPPGSPGAASTDTASPEPTPSAAPASGGRRLTCGPADLTFRATALDGPGGDETAADPVAAALRAFLQSAGGTPSAGGAPSDGGAPDLLPVAGWHHVAQASTRALFVAAGTGQDPWVMVLLQQVAGHWAARAWGSCPVSVFLPKWIGPVTWRLDPGSPAPAPRDTKVHVLVQEQTCAGGQSPKGRLLPPAIDYEPTEIVIAFSIHMTSGSCRANPEFPVAVTLDQAIGDRQLLDGSVYPAQAPPAP